MQGQEDLRELASRNAVLLEAKQEAVEELQSLTLHHADALWHGQTVC